MLSACIFKECVRIVKNLVNVSDDRYLRINSNDFALEMRSSISGKGASESALLNKYGRCDLLLFDDLGVERDTDYGLSNLYNLFNRRWENCKKTIITSNYSVEEIGKNLGVRLADRIVRSGDIVKMKGGSYAVKKIKGGKE